MEIFEHSAQDSYSRFQSSREPFLDRARDNSKLTIPSIMPEEGHNSFTDLADMYQSLGATGALNLASKLVLSLLPPNQPFFQLSISTLRKTQFEQEAAAAGIQGIDIINEINKVVINMEEIIQEEVEDSQFRNPAYNIFLNLIISGNCCMYIPPELGGKMSVFRLDQYVACRDQDGTLRELVIKEKFPRDRLPESIRDQVDESMVGDTDQDSSGGMDQIDKEWINLYTQVVLKDGFYHSRQEVGGIVVPNSDGKYTPEELPWRPLRWMSIIGEHYGRGKIDDLIGDLNSFEKLNKAITEAAHIGAKTVFFVRPGAMARPKDIAKARNGGFVLGNKEDVQALDHGNKAVDLQVAQAQANNLEIRLNKSFLNTSSIQRDAERVTAEEIRLVSQELAEALGGVYTLQSTEFQEPLLLLTIARLRKKGKLPRWNKGDITPKVTRGIEALGRNRQLNEMLQTLEVLTAIPGAMETINPKRAADKVAELNTFNLQDISFTPEELAAKRQQEMMQQMMLDSAPGVTKEVAGGVVDQQTNQQT